MTAVAGSFGGVAGDGYRPLSGVWGLAVVLVGSGTISQTSWVAFVALLQGTTAATIFAVARRLIKADWPALLATVLALLTAPAVAAQWVMLAGCQNLVILVICSGLVAYWKWLEADRRSWVYFLAIVIILYFGPLVREFTGILAVLLLWLEIGIRGRFSVVALAAAFGLVHAIFPTTLVKLFFFPDLPLKSVFTMGTLGLQTGQALGETGLSLRGLLTGLRWQAIPFALMLVPPTLSLVLGVFLFTQRSIISLLNGRLRLPAQFPVAVFIIGVIILLPWWLISVNPLLAHLLLLWLLIGIGLVGLCIHPLLPVWFLGSTLPFLIVFNQETHLLYAGVPAAIIFSGALYQVWLAASRLSSHRWALVSKVTLSLLTTLAAADQICNIVGSYRVIKSINTTEQFVSAWLVNATSDGTKLLTNALHGYDLQLFSANHIATYWTVGAGVGDPSRAVETPAQLRAFLNSGTSAGSIYLLDVDYNFTPAKIAYHSHRLLWGPAVDVEPVGRLHTISVRYPVLDPIKLLLPREYVSYLGPPDLINDFYLGPAQNGQPFTRELFAVYDLYRVTGRDATGWLPSTSPPQIVENRFKHFSIWESGNRFFGLPLGIHLDNNPLRSFGQSMCLDTTIDILKERISAGTCSIQAKGSLPERYDNLKTLGALRGFEVYRSGKEFIAVPLGSGSLNPSSLRRGNYRYKQWFKASTYSGLQRLLNAVPDSIPKDWAWLDRPDILERRSKSP